LCQPRGALETPALRRITLSAADDADVDRAVSANAARVSQRRAA